MTDTPIFTTNALALIRDLAAQGANINKIRGLLRTSEGVWFRDAEIIEAAAEQGHTVVPVNTGATQTFDARNYALLEERTGRPADKVRLVRPGSCPVPAGGYRIGRAK